MRHFLHIVNILCSHLQLTLDIHWKNWVTESLSSCLYACGWTKAEQKSPNPTLTQTSECSPLSVMCYCTVAGEALCHTTILRYLFLNFHKSAALLVCTKYNIGIQAINLHLALVMLLYLAVLQTTNLGIKQYSFFLNCWLMR